MRNSPQLDLDWFSLRLSGAKRPVRWCSPNLVVLFGSSCQIDDGIGLNNEKKSSVVQYPSCVI